MKANSDFLSVLALIVSSTALILSIDVNLYVSDTESDQVTEFGSNEQEEVTSWRLPSEGLSQGGEIGCARGIVYVTWGEPDRVAAVPLVESNQLLRCHPDRIITLNDDPVSMKDVRALAEATVGKIQAAREQE